MHGNDLTAKTAGHSSRCAEFGGMPKYAIVGWVGVALVQLMTNLEKSSFTLPVMQRMRGKRIVCYALK